MNRGRGGSVRTNRGVMVVFTTIIAGLVLLFPVTVYAHTGQVWTTSGVTSTYWTYHLHDSIPTYNCNGGTFSLGIGDSITNNSSSLTFNDFRVYSYNNTAGSYPSGGALWIQNTMTGDWFASNDLYGYALIEYTQTIPVNWTASASSSYPPYVQFNSFGGSNESEFCSVEDKEIYQP